jgi:uncharacterized membrane protein
MQLEALAQQGLLPPASLVAASVSRSTTYSGPIPPPELLKEYDIIEPGSAAKILDLYENQANHRMWLEKKVITSDTWRSWIGLGAGFFCQLFTTSVGGFLVYSGHDTAGGTIATVGLASIVATFVYGTRSQRQERVEKTRLMTGGKK